MAELKQLPLGAPIPEQRHLLITPRRRLKGFELRFDEAREIVPGGLGDAIRIAQDWAYRCCLDTIVVVGRPNPTARPTADFAARHGEKERPPLNWEK